MAGISRHFLFAIRGQVMDHFIKFMVFFIFDFCGKGIFKTSTNCIVRSGRFRQRTTVPVLFWHKPDDLLL
jgi:hypothetical protein